MMIMNNVSGVLSDADKTAVMAALDTAQEKLPFLVDLTPEQRHALPKTGDKRQSFVEAALRLVVENPDVVPPAFDVEEFKRDVALYQALAPVAQKLAQLNELVQDTLLAVGADEYVASLLVYQSAKLAGKGAGLDGALDAMGQRFAKKAGVAAAAKTAAK